MFKRSLLVVILFIFIACGRNQKPAVVETDNDSVSRSAKKDTTAKDIETASVDLSLKKDETEDNIKNFPPSLAQFIPIDYTVLNTTTGDLNLDPYPDMIMVLRKNGEDSTSDVVEHPEKRPLLVLLGQADSSYKLAARNNNAVYCVNCGGVMGDPFMEIVIKKGYFSIEHYGGSGWRWTRTTTFKYSPADGNWYLHKDGGESFHAAEPEKVKTKIRTTKDFGKLPFESFDIYKED